MKKRFFIIILIVTGFIVFFNSLSNGFVYDDINIIVENNYIKSFKDNLPKFFSGEYFTISKEVTYRPIATLTYFINYQFFKLNPFGYHFFSLLLHLINILLLFFLLNKIFNNKITSFVISLLYLLHPVVSEAVNVVTYNEDLLTVTFFLLSFICYIKMKEDDRIYYFIMSVLFYFTALLSKEMAITLPLILLLYDILKNDLITENRSGLSSIAFNKAINKNFYYYSGFALAGLIFLYLLFIGMKNPLKIPPVNYGDLFTRIIYIPYDLFCYIKLAVFPINLSAEYVFSYPDNFFSVINIISYIVFFGIIISSFYIYKYSKKIFFGIWWFIITMIPVSNIVPIYKPLADRILYLPLIGFCIIVGVLLTEVFNNIKLKNILLKQITIVLIILIIVAGYSFLTISRNSVWKDRFSLWEDVIRKNPNSPTGYSELGLVYLNDKNYDKAITSFRKANEVDKNYIASYVNLSKLYIERNMLDEALIEINKALEVSPNYILALEKLGVIYGLKGNNNDAEKVFKRIIVLDPNNIEALLNLGLIYAVQDNYNGALVQWKKVLSIDPANEQAKKNIDIVNNLNIK